MMRMSTFAQRSVLELKLLINFKIFMSCVYERGISINQLALCEEIAA